MSSMGSDNTIDILLVAKNCIPELESRQQFNVQPLAQLYVDFYDGNYAIVIGMRRDQQFNALEYGQRWEKRPLNIRTMRCWIKFLAI